MFSISVKVPKGRRKSLGIKFIEDTKFSDKSNCIDTAARLKKQNPSYDVSIVEQLDFNL